jgi:DNA-binding response OmpR family regulator
MARILIVDDEYMTVEMLSTFLGIIGHEATGAHSVRQARDKLAFAEPEAILLDIMLPDENGLDLCRELRGKPEMSTVPIIMISAHAPPMMEEATAAGANGYLIKPINLEKLKNALVKVGVA